MVWTKSGRGFPPVIRRAILERDPYCTIGRPGCTGTSTEADHIRARHLGGSDEPSNGRGACSWCHQRVTQEQAASARARQRDAAKRPAVKHPGLR